jgi:hypothetical protein
VLIILSLGAALRRIVIGPMWSIPMNAWQFSGTAVG